jgi:predicted transposase/invertase (TIGR01784 family)
MNTRKFVSFDWAIKKILRHKENFEVLEGFLSELLGFDVLIQNLLESEGNQEDENNKYNRVDILVQTKTRELMLIELQYDSEEDYFHRMVYGISKLISEYIHEGQPYGEIKKAYSINILYFRLGQGKDYIYEYEGSFVGRKKGDTLNPTNFQKKKYNIKTVADIFPKYYIIRVGSFKPETIVDTMDEWVYFLKNSEIKQEFKAKGMERAKTVLSYEGMSSQDKAAYNRHIENRRVEMNVMDTAEEKGARKKAIQVAKTFLAAGIDMDLIAQGTQLTLEEIERLANGEDIFDNYI